MQSSALIYKLLFLRLQGGNEPPCLAGLYLDAALGYCVSCPQPYVESLAASEGIESCYYFTSRIDTAIRGNNDDSIESGVSVDACKERCASRATCKSFDYADGDTSCHLADINCAEADSECRGYSDQTLYEIHRYPAGGGG
jgi:hypothetical protein